MRSLALLTYVIAYLFADPCLLTGLHFQSIYFYTVQVVGGAHTAYIHILASRHFQNPAEQVLSHKKLIMGTYNMSQHDLDAVAAIPTMISNPSTGSRSKSHPHTRATCSSSQSADTSSLCGRLCKSCQRLDLSVSRFIVDTVQQQATNEVRNHYLHRSIPTAR